jgi:hypothetical protein
MLSEVVDLFDKNPLLTQGQKALAGVAIFLRVRSLWRIE